MLSYFNNFAQMRNPTDFRLIRIRLSFWKAQIHHSSQSTINHTKVNIAMSVQTKHRIGPELLVRFSVQCIETK